MLYKDVKAPPESATGEGSSHWALHHQGACQAPGEEQAPIIEYSGEKAKEGIASCYFRETEKGGPSFRFVVHMNGF